MAKLNRRGFLVSAAAGALTVGWRLPGAAAQSGPVAVGIWAVIHPDDTIVVRIARTEMGQGTLTGLAQLVADELEADWSRVRTELVPPEVNHASKRAWGDMSTGGSRGLRGSVDYVRQGGAAAREMLVQAAAARWNVPAAECRPAKSVVTHTPTNRTLRYGELAEAASKLPVPANLPLKDPSAWTIIGKPVARLDTPGKLNGSQQYAIDVRLPDMLSASIAQSPVFGAKLVAFDAKAIESMPGVRHVLPVGDAAIAVVADTWWQANSALRKLPVTWSETPNASVTSASIAAHMQSGLDATDAGAGNRNGDAVAALASAAKRIEATYATPFLNHATLEPMNCTAMAGGNRVEVWAPTQNGDATLAAAAEAGGVPLANVKVNKFTLGGGFGRRGQQDYVRLAVTLAKQVPGRPIKLVWSREEDMQHGFYRPISQCKLTGGLDEKGNLTALHMRISGQSINAWLRPGRQPARRGPAADAGRGAGGVRLQRHPQPAGRLRDAQHARAGRALARRQPQPERRLYRVFHR